MGVEKIKISLPLVEEDLNYEHNLDITDDELYHFVAKQTWFGNDMAVNINSKIKRERLTWSKEKLIEEAKKTLPPLVPDEEEFIPREYWCALDELIGVKLTNLYHPVWQLFSNAIKDNFVKNSDTMVIQPCTNRKPYLTTTNYKWCLKKHREGYFDLWVGACLVPIDFSPFYPYRYYDWNHQNETPCMRDVIVSHYTRDICDYVEYFGYKRVIFFNPIEKEGLYTDLIKRIKNIFEGSKVEIIAIHDENSVQEIKDYYGISHPGIIKTRYYTFMPGKRRLEKLIGYDENRKVDPKDYKYGHKNKELIKYLERDKTSTYTPPTKEDKITEEVKEIVKEEVSKIKPKIKEIDNSYYKGVYMPPIPPFTNLKPSKKSTNKYSFSLVNYLYENLSNILEKGKGYKRRDLIKLVKSKLPADEYTDVYLTKNINSMTINYPKKKELVRENKLIIKDDLIYLLEENDE